MYNLCSGRAYAIREMLDLLLKMSSQRITVEQDPQRVRPSDVPVLLGDGTKFFKQTGWKTEIPFPKTLEDLLNYWRSKVKHRATNVGAPEPAGSSAKA